MAETETVSLDRMGMAAAVRNLRGRNRHVQGPNLPADRNLPAADRIRSPAPVRIPVLSPALSRDLLAVMVLPADAREKVTESKVSKGIAQAVPLRFLDGTEGR